MKGRLGSAAVVAVAIAALSGAAAPKAAGPARPDPAAFVERLVVQIVRDDYARAWLTLHPAHKAVATRWTYVDCELLSPIPGRIDSLRILRVERTRHPVPGRGRLPVTAVTFHLVLSGVEITHTSNLVEVDGRWRWILTPERYELYRAGSCAGDGPSA
jgi:hypothetical protein